MYQIRYFENGLDMVFRVFDAAWIPADPANTDYQAYLTWLEEGNEPEVIDISD